MIGIKDISHVNDESKIQKKQGILKGDKYLNQGHSFGPLKS